MEMQQVAQRDEVIILDSIHNSPSYNYNSAIPNSVPSSIAPSVASSTISRNQTPTPHYSGAPPPPFSSTASPPPSFHTLSSPGTPRPAHSIRTSHSGVPYAELWGVAASTVGGTMTETEGGLGIGTSNDALATIAGLRTRVEWLEESIGRLLIQKDTLYSQSPHDCGESSSSRGGFDDGNNPSSSSNKKRGDPRNNCCVTFTSTTPDLERAIANGGRNNCCVTFRSAAQVDRRANALTAVKLVLFALVVMFVTLGISGGGHGGGNGSGRDNIRIGSVDGGVAEEIVHGNGFVGIEASREVVGSAGGAVVAAPAGLE